MADLQGVGSNRILEHLEEWNKLLQHSSLAKRTPDTAIESEDEDAPSDRSSVVARRRRKA